MSIGGKLFIKFLFAVLVIGIIAPFSIIKGPDGNTLMSVSNVKQDLELSWYKIKFKYQALKNELLSTELISVYDKPEVKATQLYRWRDAQGTLSYGDTPHPVYSSEPMEVKPVMTMHSYDSALIQEQEATAVAQQANNKSATLGISSKSGYADETLNDSSSGFSLTTVPISKIPELIQQAKDIRKLSNQRAEALEQL